MSYTYTQHDYPIKKSLLYINSVIFLFLGGGGAIKAVGLPVLSSGSCDLCLIIARISSSASVPSLMPGLTHILCSIGSFYGWEIDNQSFITFYYKY